MAHRVVDSGIGTLALKNPQRKGEVMEVMTQDQGRTFHPPPAPGA